MSATRPPRRIARARHLGALACVAPLAFVALRLLRGADVRAGFAAVGMLYALAFAVAVVPRPRAAAVVGFALAGGVLNAATAAFAWAWGPGLAVMGVPSVVGLSAAVGALSFAILLRVTWLPGLGARRAAKHAAGCAVAAMVAARCAGASGDALWVVSMAWWAASSVVLCSLDVPAGGAR